MIHFVVIVPTKKQKTNPNENQNCIYTRKQLLQIVILLSETLTRGWLWFTLLHVSTQHYSILVMMCNTLLMHVSCLHHAHGEYGPALFYNGISACQYGAGSGVVFRKHRQ